MLSFSLFCGSFPRLLSWDLSSFVFLFPSLFIKVCRNVIFFCDHCSKFRNVNFSVTTTLNVSHKFWYVVFSFHYLFFCSRFVSPLSKSSLIESFPDSSGGKESACNAGGPSLIPGLGRSPGESNSYSLQYSGLENSMDYAVHGVTKISVFISLYLFCSWFVFPFLSKSSVMEGF